MLDWQGIIPPLLHNFRNADFRGSKKLEIKLKNYHDNISLSPEGTIGGNSECTDGVVCNIKYEDINEKYGTKDLISAVEKVGLVKNIVYSFYFCVDSVTEALLEKLSEKKNS